MTSVLARPPSYSNAHTSLRTTEVVHNPKVKLVMLGHVDIQFSN